MHCPDCGSEAPAGQKFCRACGLNLERFAQLLGGLPPDAEDENVERAKVRLRQLEKAGKIAGVTIVFLAFIGVYWAIVTGNIGTGIMLLTFAAIIAAVQLAGYYSSLKKKTSERPPSQLTPPSAEITNKLLPEDQQRIATSVTEQTTARLEEKIKPRRLDE